MSELAHLLAPLVFAPESSDDDTGAISRFGRGTRDGNDSTALGTSDEQLVQSVRRGDQAAFAEMFRQHAPALAVFVEGYLKDAAVAEEVVQDVFLWILRNRDAWVVRGSVRAYLYRAARNGAFDYLKHRAVERRWADRLGAEDSVVLPEADTRVVVDEQIAELARAISRLPESRRTALTLRWMDGLSYAEIATILGSSAKAVEVQLNRTLRQLRALMGQS